MKTIDIDARLWKDKMDFYDALLWAVGAPSTHGRNINALIDSIVYGGVNSVEPPFVVRIHNTETIPESVINTIDLLINEIALQRKFVLETRGRDCNVEFQIDR